MYFKCLVRILQRAENYLNAYKDRELSLRGLFRIFFSVVLVLNFPSLIQDIKYL